MVAYSNSVGLARCGVKKANWKSPKACPPGWSPALIEMTLPGSDKTGSASCIEGSWGDTTTSRVLAFGKKISRGGITCASSRKGMACTKKGPHGFFISRKNYKLF